MNWIERMYEIKGRDLYSQNGEGLLLEYVFNNIGINFHDFVDIGGGDGFYLSNTKHLGNLNWSGEVFDIENGIQITKENVLSHLDFDFDLLSIDIDGNDYWIIQQILTENKPRAIIAEFNPAIAQGNPIAIKYNPDHLWDGTDYYGFSLDAAFTFKGYKPIFVVGNMNIILVREDLIKVKIPPLTYTQTKFFKESSNTDWVIV